MDFVDLKTQQNKIKAALDGNIQKVLAHGNYIMGPEVKELEKALGAYVGVQHAISCASGTDALLMALNIGRGDAVFTTPFTFTARLGPCPGLCGGAVAYTSAGKP